MTAIAPPPSRPVIVAAPSLPVIPFVPAKFFRVIRRQPARWIVLHCTHGAEGIGKAMACAQMFHDAPPERAVSAHYAVDTTAIVRCVNHVSEAWHAGRTANAHGIAIELCGSADQTREQWLDAKSLPMLELAARLVATLCHDLGIPVAPLGPTGLRSLTPGITTHAAVSKAFPTETDHWDPGPGFPAGDFIAAVLNARLTPPTIA